MKRCSRCSKPLTRRQIREGNACCSKACGQRWKHGQNEIEAVLAILKANFHRHPLIDAVGHQARSGDARCLSGRVFIDEASEVRSFAADLHVDLPLPVSPTPMDIAVARRGAGESGLVLHVAGMRDQPKVRASIVEPITVDMVSLDPISDNQPEKFSVQLGPISTPPSVNAAIGVTGCAELPAPLVDVRGISSVDEGVGADRTISSVQGHSGGYAIGVDLHATAATAGRTDGAASAGAVDSLAGDVARKSGEGAPAGVARKIDSHRQSTPGGVTPPAVCTGAGVSACQLYHPWLTASDLAFARYGSDDPDDVHAVQQTLYHLKRRGVPIETRPMPELSRARSVVIGYRLAQARKEQAA